MENENQDEMEQQILHDCVVVNGVLLFADGTWKERDAKAPVRKPESEEKRVKLIMLFWQKKLKLAIQEFDHERNQRLRYARGLLTDPAGFAPNETVEDATRVLTELKRKVEFCRERLAKAETELTKFQRPVEESRANDFSRELVQDYLTSVEKIEI
jgi:hypothetical protein